MKFLYPTLFVVGVLLYLDACTVVVRVPKTTSNHQLAHIAVDTPHRWYQTVIVRAQK